MASDGPDKLDYRVMGDYSISKSYKGILRIAHIMETVGTEKDYFLNPTYYGAPTSLMDISGSDESSKIYGFPNASVGFEGKVKRYLSDKEYKDMKLPMTDSMGNYLNWNIGVDGTTIGSDMENNGYSIFRDKILQDDFNEEILQSRFFPVLESRELVIGLESKLRGDEKTYFSNAGKLFLIDDDKKSSLVISNLYDNSPSNKTPVDDVSDGFTFNKDTKFKHRTIYKSTKDSIEEYDAFVYNQENYNSKNFFCTGEENLSISETDIQYNRNNFENIKPKTHIDAEVDIINLKDYVKDIISKYMKSNTVEVPTGTVIYQYISPEKWYASGDSGSGNGEFCTLSKDSYPGHRPNMGQRSSTEGNNTWNDSMIQGATYKTNKLSVRNNRYKEKTEEDSAFDSARLKEIIPLYKRDYVLCDGSTYYISLIENNSANPIYKKRFESYDRFINLFYNIGYTYSEKKNSSSPFSDIKQRFQTMLVESDGIHRFRLKNLCADYESQDDYQNYIDNNNYMKYDRDEGTPFVAPWNYLNNLKDSETLYSTDLVTMLAYKLLLEEDGKDINSAFIVDGRYNRDMAESWLKSQPIPINFVFNTFVGDTEDTIKQYSRIGDDTSEIGVIQMPYIMTNGDSRKISIGREVTTFGSKMKYFVPDKDGGKYYICEAWQIAEIQYILDVFASGSGERNLILPSKFEFKFKVPNLTETQRPKFIGSTGFNWRDQRKNDMEVSGSWSSSYTNATIPHRHAIFKGSLGGFGSNDNLVKFKAETLNNDREIPTSSAYLHELGEMPEGGKNGAAGGEVTDGTGSYIWNELGELEGVYFEQNVSLYGINILQRGNFLSEFWGYMTNNSNDGDTTGENITSGITGPWGTVFQKTGQNRAQRKNDFTVGNNINYDFYMDYPKGSTDYQEYLDWYLGKKNDLTQNKIRLGGENKKWYSFQHDEDPRFDNIEPNRCPTSPPKYYEANKYVIYTKNDVNENNSPDGTCFFFAPEHVKATPLIKL